MTRRLVVAGASVLVAGGVWAGAARAAMPMEGGGPMVSILATEFAPERTAVLAGDTVMWHNDSVLRHTVTADDGSFSSKQLFGGDAYSRRFDSPGVVEYYCKVHAYMHGEVDVHRVLLDAPHEPGSPRAAYTLRGRAALAEGDTVSIERRAGDGWAPAGEATVDAHGAFTARVRSRETTRFRALGGGDTSPSVRLLIVDRRVHARRHGGVITARVTPSSPGATVVLQLRLRNRFGWWPVARHRAGRHSRARFRVRHLDRRVRARVVLTLSDGATQLARTHVFKVGPRR